MGARVRRGPTFLGWLAVALSGGAIVAFIAEVSVEVQVLTWTRSLWVSGVVAGLPRCSSACSLTGVGSQFDSHCSRWPWREGWLPFSSSV
jgi:hypothetical protein